MKNKFGFYVTRYENISKQLLTSSEDPSPIKESVVISGIETLPSSTEKQQVNNKELPLSHRFIKCKMEISGLTKIKTGKALYEEYALWRTQELATTLDERFKSELLSDPIKSTRLFTGSFKKKEELSPGDKYYLDRYGSNKWAIRKVEFS